MSVGRALEVDVNQSAFLFLGFQVDVCVRGGKLCSRDPDVRAMLRYTRRRARDVIVAVRRAALLTRGGPPIVHLVRQFTPGYAEIDAKRADRQLREIMQKRALVSGTRGVDIVPELVPLPGELVIDGIGLSPFVGSSLRTCFEQRGGVDTLFLAGIETQHAVLAATVASADRGFRVVVIRDACGARRRNDHEAAIEMLRPLAVIADSRDVIAALDRSRRRLEAADEQRGSVAVGSIGVSL